MLICSIVRCVCSLSRLKTASVDEGVGINWDAIKAKGALDARGSELISTGGGATVHRFAAQRLFTDVWSTCCCGVGRKRHV